MDHLCAEALLLFAMTTQVAPRFNGSRIRLAGDGFEQAAQEFT